MYPGGLPFHNQEHTEDFQQVHQGPAPAVRAPGPEPSLPTATTKRKVISVGADSASKKAKSARKSHLGTSPTPWTDHANLNGCVDAADLVSGPLPPEGAQLDASKVTDMCNVFTEDLAQETSFSFSTEGKVWDLQETDEVDEEEVLELLELQHLGSDSSLA
ncbi:hypothetical protein B9479_005455 [Cryptococcus floricola]|uniref:Uncharacterized protein n=1 Tax=Cryptococcus floricola TaxID=2591691 RepID=A0A5D3AVR2_9TREE|nr:hypothetical protein B9479_005455 [Cryptococcus floricola]